MNAETFNGLLKQVARLTLHQRELLRKRLDALDGDQKALVVIESPKSERPRSCPHCQSCAVDRHGLVSGLQRYRCQACHRTFNALTGTALARLRKKDKWLGFSAALVASQPLRPAAAALQVHRNTTPSGVIRSTQPYLLYEYPVHSLLDNGWNASTPDGKSPSATSLAAKPQEFSLVMRSYRIPSSVVQDDGQPQHRSLQLLGVEWLSYLDDRWFVKLESEGAMGGQRNGYMQILAGGGYRLPLTRSTALKLHAAAGPAGGGRVDTGGGLLLDAGIALQQNLTQRTAVELSVGAVRAPSRSFKATSVGLKLNYQFGLPAVSSNAISWNSLGGFETKPLRVRAVNQTYFKGHRKWRSSFADQSVNNIGVQLDYFVSPNWFLTGQGLGAYAGMAGAYMAGLVGVGGQLPVSDRWFVEGEALLGAAGGGGLAVGKGLVSQVNAGVGYRLTKSLSVMTTLGHVSALRGDFKAKVLGVSLGYQFTDFAEK